MQAQSNTQRTELALLPPVDIVEDATGITLTADLPGI
jgi:HSP20 family molecular chaperone IbpA